MDENGNDVDNENGDQEQQDQGKDKNKNKQDKDKEKEIKQDIEDETIVQTPGRGRHGKKRSRLDRQNEDDEIEEELTFNQIQLAQLIKEFKAGEIELDKFTAISAVLKDATPKKKKSKKKGKKGKKAAVASGTTVSCRVKGIMFSCFSFVPFVFVLWVVYLF